MLHQMPGLPRLHTRDQTTGVGSMDATNLGTSALAVCMLVTALYRALAIDYSILGALVPYCSFPSPREVSCDAVCRVKIRTAPLASQMRKLPVLLAPSTPDVVEHHIL